jgi:putative flippase GtrA
MRTYLKQNGRKIALFVVIGVLNSALDFLILNLLSYFFGVGAWWSYTAWKSISFACALFQSYYLNKRFTFADRGRGVFSLFVIVTIGSFLINVALSSVVYHLIATIGVSTFLALNISALVGIAGSMVTNFIGYNYVVFK